VIQSSKMAQDLNAIISELDAAYNPSRQTINDRINGLQGAESADIAGLEGQKVQAFDDITNGARSKGMGFSGIPIQEQAKYSASSFLPAVAKVKQSYNEGRNSLVDALNNMNIDQRKTAMSIRETQQNRDFEAQQAALARQAQERASAAANASSGAMEKLFNQQQQQTNGLPAGMEARSNALGKLTGFNFTVAGKPASAAQFAAANKLPVSDVLYKMATSGDTTAANAYNWLSRIQKVDPQGFAKGTYKNTAPYKQFSSLFWGT
jgi:hypothetical protein